MRPSSSAPPLSSSSSQQRNRDGGAGPSHADMQPINSIDEPAPTLVNRHSRSHSVWSAHVPQAQTPTQATAHAHAQHPHPHPHPSGIVTRLEEGLHEFTDKFEHELTELTEIGPLTRTRSKRKTMWDRFRGVGRRKVGWGESCRNVIRSSVLNILLLFIPFAWASAKHWKLDNLTFAFCFISIIPLEKLFDFGGEQMALYTGKDLGDLIMVTLNNAVEATLAIILLLKCELRILQATIVGVVLLHLLLVPGTGFLTGGARIYEQTLHPHYTQLNHTLLAVGCLSLIIPVAFFSALDTGTAAAEGTLTSVADRVEFLQMSRGIAILLLLVYVASRIFLHNPPGEGNNTSRSTPEALRKQEEDLSHEDAKLNPWFCVLFLIVTIAVMAVTAELLVESIEHVRENGNITEEWFGLILLPLVSFSADGAVAVIYFLRAACFMKAEPPKTLAEDRAIDLSIQFTLFWMPFLVLIAWWTGRPLMLLFDLYEIAVLLAACFLVNYVTADSKTNWAEGYIMITFYILIALCTWFYPGQAAINALTSICRARSLGGDALGEAAAVVEEVAGEVVQDLRRRDVFGG